MGTTFKETKIGLIPDDWELLPFDDFTDKKGGTGKYQKLQTKDYLDEGRYPIIDQGKEFIAGYTNDENDVYTGSLPVTIFGDHTLFVKFVNMEFAIGADGTVPLYPNKNKLTDKFFYYLICNHKIKSEGYQRHLKYLKQKWFAIPPLPEQRKVAEILSTVDETIEKTDAIIQETLQLKKGLMQKLFTEGIGHTRFNETKIGRIPEEWEMVRFIQCLQKSKQKDPTKKPDEKFIYIDVSAVSNESFKIVESNTILGKDAPSRARKEIKTGDTIYATVRPYLKRVAFVPVELDGEICSTGYCVLRPKSEEISHRFVFQLMLTHRVNEYLKSLQAGTSYPAISDSDVYQMLIPKPPLPEQRQIAEILSEVDSKIETEQAFKAEMEQLKKGLMQVLLTGKVRVKV